MSRRCVSALCENKIAYWNKTGVCKSCRRRSGGNAKKYPEFDSQFADYDGVHRGNPDWRNVEAAREAVHIATGGRHDW